MFNRLEKDDDVSDVSDVKIIYKSEVIKGVINRKKCESTIFQLFYNYSFCSEQKEDVIDSIYLLAKDLGVPNNYIYDLYNLFRQDLINEENEVLKNAKNF